MVGLHKTVRLSFLIVGHTKFSPDWCFGLLKQRFRKTPVNSLKDIEEVVDGSAVVNISQLVGNQSGEVIVPTYDWSTYFGQHFSKIPSIKAQHHFLFSHVKPGVVRAKQLLDSDEVEHNLCQRKDWVPSFNELPPLIAPKGLSMERKWYLYQKIRDFCSPESKDLVCPYPGPGPCPPSPRLPPPSPTPSDVPPSPCPSALGRKRRTCGHCGDEGNNSRTCKKTRVKCHF